MDACGSYVPYKFKRGVLLNPLNPFCIWSGIKSKYNFAYSEFRSTDARIPIDLVHTCPLVDTGVWQALIYLSLTVDPFVARSTQTFVPVEQILSEGRV